MLTPGPRVIAIAAGLFGLFVLAVVAYFQIPPRQTGNVAMPPDDASPEQVIAAYLDAINVHDCDTAVALVTASRKDSASGWCSDASTLTDIVIGEPARGSGPPGSGNYAGVPVSFTVDWRPLRGDGSIDDGLVAWNYYLTRRSADSPWRIWDAGVG